MNSTETQVRTDIEALRATVSETRMLYREVCTVLFFRYGITPTANMLYQYVRKGSMSAPAEALAKFWEELREKSRVRIEHPDLPDGLKTAAADLVATLWSQAQAAAQEGLGAFRVEAESAVLEARMEKNAAEDEREAALKDLAQVRSVVQAGNELTLELERKLAAVCAEKAVLMVQLEAAARQQSNLETGLTEARRDFAAELEMLRQALQRSQERNEAAEKRALLEIDRERTRGTKLQKDLAQALQTHQDAERQHHAGIAQLQSELGGLRQKYGIAEGTLLEVRGVNKRQAEQLQSLGTALAERDMQNVLLLRELEVCQKKSAALAVELQQLRVVLPAGKREGKLKLERKAADERPSKDERK